MKEMSDEQRRKIEQVYAKAIAFVTVRGEPNMLLVFPNTDEGFSERMAVAQAFSATHRPFEVNEKEDFAEFFGAKPDVPEQLPYPALYLPTHRLKNGVDEEIAEMAVLRGMNLHHLHSDIGDEDVMHHLEAFLQARDSAEALLAAENGALTPDTLSGHILTEDNGFPKSTLQDDKKAIGKIVNILGKEHPILLN